MHGWQALGSRYYERHRRLLENAVGAIGDFGTPTAFPTAGPRTAYGSGALAFRTLLGRRFDLGQPAASGEAATESSPYGIELGISYPRCDPGLLVAAAQRAMPGWRAAGPYERAGIAVEI